MSLEQVEGTANNTKVSHPYGQAIFHYFKPNFNNTENFFSTRTILYN